MQLFTIGHSNDPFERFIALLKKNGIAVVADVRRIPYSRFARQFNKSPLSSALENAGIRYLFMGDSLGGKITDPEFLSPDGRVDYERVMSSQRFRKGISRLEEELHRGRRVAIMCAEKDPLKCHRFFLISRFLHRKGYPVRHIVNDRVISHEKLEEKARGSLSQKPLRFLEKT